MMKRLLTMLLCSMLLCSCLTGTACAAAPSVVTTIFPIYDWTMALLGDNPAGIEVKMLLDNGLDLHNYQPTVPDILAIGKSDLFIYVGGESDEWVDGALANAINKDMLVLNLLDALGDAALEEELVEGMEAEEEDEDEAACDEHVWLSLRNARVLCQAIADDLCAIDPANADAYTANAEIYIAQLNELDNAYQAAVATGSTGVLLFGDRFPFRYLVEDYGLTYYAAFLGCSAETEASFATIAFLAGKADELGLRCVMTLEGSDHQLADTIIRTTRGRDQQILEMNSMQSIVQTDVDTGVHYLDLMQRNLDVLTQALQ